MLRRILCRLGRHRYDHHEVLRLVDQVRVTDTCDCGEYRISWTFVGKRFP